MQLVYIFVRSSAFRDSFKHSHISRVPCNFLLPEMCTRRSDLPLGKLNPRVEHEAQQPISVDIGVQGGMGAGVRAYKTVPLKERLATAKANNGQ